MSKPPAARAGTLPNAAQANMIHMVNGRFELPAGTSDAMSASNELVDHLVRQYASLAATYQHDGPTATLVYRMAQQLRNLMNESFILPHGPGEFVPDAEPEVIKRKRSAAAKLTTSHADA